MAIVVHPLVELAWTYLSPSYPKYHVEAVRGLWQIQLCLSAANHEIEGAICSLITRSEANGTFSSRDADPAKRFGILWTHLLNENAGMLEKRRSEPFMKSANFSVRDISFCAYDVMLARPLFLLLDALSDERTQLFDAVRTWLQGLSGVDRFVQYPFRHVLRNLTVQQTLSSICSETC